MQYHERFRKRVDRRMFLRLGRSDGQSKYGAGLFTCVLFVWRVVFAAYCDEYGCFGGVALVYVLLRYGESPLVILCFG